ncbi:Disease resistance protein (CC-NBS-LRR class) family [Rhynchospora pubera]|uniref:Disease resistance protein (CC-NBS-LRR class) family n=1 Tax=Rhynchospora pubera TaxID=906938 RepID=A0AAV8CPU5_9POAL|nr:Disease resistance protein (CC-NBS-LRR class) family [Rhynchospora pubera]
MAEGFVRPKRGMTLEEVAEEYFYELINRNLIQPSYVGVDERIRSCRVHDIMRELLVAKSIEENLVFITGEQENMTPIDSFRHLAITGSKEIRTTNLHGIRSVSIFHAHVPSVISTPSKLKLVKILDLDDTTKLEDRELDDTESRNNVEQVIRHLGQFKHLKYVSIPRYENDTRFPNSLGNLRDLQTLEIRSDVRTLPKNIIKLHNLRRLRIGRDFEPEGVALPKGIGNLKELHVLKWVNFGRSHRRVVGELAQLRQLRKLGVANLGREHYEKFSASISELSSLRSLKISLAESEEAAVGILDSVASPPEHLRSIKLHGWIGKLPAWVSSLYNLAKVKLWRTRLDDDAIVVLQQLPNLLLLRLGNDSYVGAKLTFRSAKFSKLKQLFVSGLENLEELVFEEGTSPELQTLVIWWCELKSGISGAEHLPKLKKLIFDYRVYVANLDEVLGQVGAALEIRSPEYQKEREDFYRGTASSGGPPAEEHYSRGSDTEERENNSSRCPRCIPHF